MKNRESLRRTGSWRDSFVWIDYDGYIVKHTDNGGVGIVAVPNNDSECEIEFWIPDTAIKEIAYVEGGDNPNIMLGKRFTSLLVQRDMAIKKGLMHDNLGNE